MIEYLCSNRDGPRATMCGISGIKGGIMKALVLTEYNKFEYLDVPDPSYGPDEVLLQVKACGICGSDVHGMDGSTGRRQPPIIMGHEASGVIVEVGDQVKDWKKGDRVTFDSTIYCGTCVFCRKGEINLCENRRVMGVSCDDYRQDGAFAEYVVVPQHILYALPDNLPFYKAAMVEALSVAVHAFQITPVGLNDTAVVFGTGMIGLLVIQVLRVGGCGRIIAVDIDNNKLETARRLGADITLNNNECVAADEIKKYTKGLGADIGFEVVGITPTVQGAIGSVRKGGSVTLVGNISPSVELPLQQVVTQQKTLYGSCASSGEYPACLELIDSGKIDVDALISERVPLSEGNMWFQRLKEKGTNLMKVIVEL